MVSLAEKFDYVYIFFGLSFPAEQGSCINLIVQKELNELMELNKNFRFSFANIFTTAKYQQMYKK